MHRFAITFTGRPIPRRLASKLMRSKASARSEDQILALLKEADRENLESRLKELHLTDEQIQEIKSGVVTSYSFLHIIIMDNIGGIACMHKNF